MTILLFGKNGQVGGALEKSLSPCFELVVCDREQVDLGDSDAIKNIVRDVMPNIVINAAAYTAVDKAESERDSAFQINADAVGILARETKQLQSLLVHYSTDYVFDGNKDGWYTENDAPNPQSVYGSSKFAGEELIRKSGCDHLIFRTSWVYASRGNNFVKTILQLAEEKTDLRVVADQFGVPTSADLIAETTKSVLQQLQGGTCCIEKVSGTYNVVPSGKTSWHGYAQHILHVALDNGFEVKASPETVEPISTEEFSQAATRPRNSSLDTTKLCTTFDISLPRWEIGVERIINELLTSAPR